MKNSNRIAALVLSVIMLLSCFCAAAYASDDVTVSGVEYTKAYLYDTDGNYGQFYKVKSCAASGKIEIPDNIGGIKVVAVEDGAFRDNSRITEAVIPSTVAKIGESAFYGCITLRTVTVNSSKCSLGKNTFYGCSSLESVVLPSALSSIPEGTFSRCQKLAEISIPETVTTIGKNAFISCASLEEIVIPEKVNSIGLNAFANCGKVRRFSVDEKNTAYKTIDSCLFDIEGKTLIQYPLGCGKTVLTVPDGTETVGNYAAGGNSAIEKVVLPDSVKTVSAYAFYSAPALFDVTLPEGLEFIGSMAFAKCGKLENIIIPKTVSTFDGAFYQSGLKSVTLESGITGISEKAFEKCESLETVNIPSSVERMELGAFDGCTSLKALSIPENVKTIGNGVFRNCSQLRLTVVCGSPAHKYAKDNGIPFDVTGEKSVASIEIVSEPNKTKYYYKSELKTDGLAIKVSYNDDTTETVTTGFSVSPTYFDFVGERDITVTYGGETCTFKVRVSYSFWQILIRIFLLGFLWF